MPYVTTSVGVQSFVKDWGSRRPFALVGGGRRSLDTWDAPGLTPAENGDRAISRDRRGSGRSEQPRQGHGNDRTAEDLRAIITELDLRDATIVGFPMVRGEAAPAVRQARPIEYDGAPHGPLATHDGNLAGDLLAFLDG